MSSDSTARLWSTDGVSIKPVPVVTDHRGPLIDITFDRAETRIVTTDRVGGAILTDLADGHHVSFVGHGNGAVLFSSFSPNGEFVVTASEDRTARLWSAYNGDLLDVAVGHTDAVSRARFSPDGSYVLTAARDGTARIWRVLASKKLQPVMILRGHTRRIYDALFSKTGSRVVTASVDGTARIWNLEDAGVTEGSQKSQVEDLASEVVLSGHSSWVYSVAFSSENELVATASHDGTARVWSATTPKAVRHVLAHSSTITLVRHDPRTRRLLTGSRNGELKLWDVDTLSQVAAFEGHEATITAAEFHRNGRLIITGGADGKVILWKIGSSRPDAILVDDGDLISSVSFHPQQDIALVTSFDRSVRLFDLNAALERQDLQTASSAWLKGGLFSPDGKTFLTWSIDGTAVVWDLHSKEPTRKVQLCESSVEQAVFSPVHTDIIGACVDGKLAIWSEHAGVKRMPAHDKPMRHLAFSLNGQRLVTSADDGKIAIWNTGDWQPTERLGAHE